MIELKCKHNKRVVIGLDAISSCCWDDGAYLTLTGCEICEKEVKTMSDPQSLGDDTDK
jgi:hypothetical protein